MKRMTTYLATLTLLMAAVAGFGPQALAGEAGGGETASGPRLSVPQLIEKMHGDGEIDYSTALRYKILWFKKWDLLPERLKANTDVLVRCGTPVVKEIHDNFDKLSPEDRKWLADKAGIPDLKTLGGRPAFSYTLQSATLPLRVHYEETGHQTMAEKMLVAYEHSWQVEVNEMGFFAPPGDMGVEGSDDYDIYVSVAGGGGTMAYTAPESQVDGTWWNDRTSYIVQSPKYNSDEEIESTASHEFQHACQMAMAYETTIGFYENTAVWVEPHVYPEWDEFAWDYARWYQVDPWRPVCGFDMDDVGLYQYGGFMWPEFFCERVDQWDSTVIREMWDWMRDPVNDDQHNTFDAMAHFANIYDPGGAPGGGDWELYDLVMEMSEWRYFCGQWLADDAHYTYAEEFPQINVAAEHRHTSLPALSPTTLPDQPEFFGVNYVRFDEAITNETDLTVYFSGEAEHNGFPIVWKLGVIKVFEVGGAFSYEYHDVPQDTQDLWLTISDVDQCERLVMVVANLGNGFLNPGPSFPSKYYSYIAWPGADPNTSVLIAGPGPGPDNEQNFRAYLAHSDAIYTDRLHVYGYGYGTNVSTGDIDGDGITEMVCGSGPDPEARPRFRGYELGGNQVVGTNTFAYGVDKFGVNVACGDIDGDGVDEILTGPGPGPPFGPQVRGWKFDEEAGSTDPVPGVNYFAYGTLKFGVNVSAGDIDGDGYDEIVTGAGPGAVFGPHVRGWNFDGSGSITAIPGVSYLAYGVPKWGVNVACGDIDGDGIDEIITGPGPGAVYGPHVRGWNYDGGTLTSMPGVSYFAYGTLKWGVEVGAGDVDEDGIDEILTGAGPGNVFGAHVRGWNYDGDTVDAINTINFFAWPYDGEDRVRYGVNVAVGNLLPSI